MNRMLLLVLAILLPAIAAAQVADERDTVLTPGASVAFLGITFIDTSTEGAYDGERPDQTARTVLLEEAVRSRFTEEGFVLVDTAPVAERLEATTNPAECYGCDVRMAEQLGADYVLVGEVQKVSNLIISMNLVMRAVPEATMVRGLSVDVRSNTDESWMRGLNYILKNHFFKT